jgi:hypothetical protein
MPAHSPTPEARSDAVSETERWFVKHGLPYFVPGERAAARAAMQPRRTIPLLVGAGLAAVGLAILLGLVFKDLSMGAAALTLVGVAAALAYAITALRARRILTWAVQRTIGSLRQLVPTVTRALPLLIVFVTFLFVNAEVWHVAANLDGGVLWLVVLFFTLMGVGFFLVRLPEEIDLADDELDDARIVVVTEGTPLAAESQRLATERPGLLVEETQVSRFERVNLTVALVIIQLSQVLLVALALMMFFIIFGVIAMDRDVMEAWIGEPTHSVPKLPNLSLELFQVAVFLSAFSGLYISVTAATDETYRSQFFTGIMREMERAIAVRAAYNALRKDRGDVLEDDPARTPVEPLRPNAPGGSTSAPAAAPPAQSSAPPAPASAPASGSPGAPVDGDATVPLHPVPPENGWQ